MFGHPPLYPLPLREGTLTLDTLQLAAGWFICQDTTEGGDDGHVTIMPAYTGNVWFP